MEKVGGMVNDTAIIKDYSYDRGKICVLVYREMDSTFILIHDQGSAYDFFHHLLLL